jgi:hypothetical protein
MISLIEAYHLGILEGLYDRLENCPGEKKKEQF